MPTRRGFLRSLLAGVAGVAVAETLDLDRLLWEPGKKTVFDLWTPEPVWDLDTLVTPEWVTREMVDLLAKNMKFMHNINRQYDDRYALAGAKVGGTVRIRLPNRWDSGLVPKGLQS